MNDTDFDAIVIGSGITGGWAAKELTEGGLKVLMIERGRNVVHGQDYITEFKEPWEVPFRGEGDRNLRKHAYPVQSLGPMSEFSRHFWVKDTEEPYKSAEDRPYKWLRGYQLGGRSLTWGRQSLRLGEADFLANKRDGHGVDWPIRYADISPWYDQVEEFIGISGQTEGVSSVPDGIFTPPMPLNCVETHLREVIAKKFPGRVLTTGRTANLTEKKQERGLCQLRDQCERGCSWGGYFSTQSSTLPAAEKTGLLTVMTDTRVVNINYDPDSKRATGVNVINEKTRDKNSYNARTIFLCASTFNSIQLLLQSNSEHFPNGLANSSGVLGHYIMDHIFGPSAIAIMPGFDNQVEKGRRPTYQLVLPFRNREGDTDDVDFIRSYILATGAMRLGWSRGDTNPGFGAEFKDKLSGPGPWVVVMLTMGEVLPYKNNFVELDHASPDRLGFPQLKIHVAYGENEKKMALDSAQQARTMLTAAGANIISESSELDVPGTAIHEMGGARMGRDASSSVLNAYNQCHDVPNLFVTDGAAMSSSGAQNPSLTYMALTARACNYAIEELKTGML